jgi:hypothetical protein
MTEFIHDFYQSQMQNGEFIAFHNDTLEEMERANIGRWFTLESDAYRDRVTETGRTFAVFSASSLSPEITRLDQVRGQRYSALKAFVKVQANDDEDAEKAAAAERILFIIRKTAIDAGNPLRLGLVKETAAINTLLANLEPVTGDIEQIGATRQLEKLADANRAFAGLHIDRDTEKGDKPSGDMKPVRAVATDAYDELAAMINAYMRLHKDEELGRLVRTHNATIEKYKNLIAQRKGRGGNKGGDKE